MKGLIFDIEEFAVFDGPGIRSVIFLKGCPLTCAWCHNPEGLSHRPQRVKAIALCTKCGRCDAACLHPDACEACGSCVRACPSGCLRIAGTFMEDHEAAARILRHEKLLRLNGGGVTFSGGEPLMQVDFVLAVREKLKGLNALIETSGYAPERDFLRAARAMDFVIMDIKIVDPASHRKYAGVDNALILRNLETLKALNKPFRIRVPLIPTVTDTRGNLRAVARHLRGAKALEKVELMRYNKAAGAKYSGVGLAYQPPFPEDREPELHLGIFKEENIPCDVL